MAQAANGWPNKFITLTSRRRPEQMTVHEAARELVHAWRMVVQRAKREGIFKDIQYIAVFELTDKGWPHLHICARSEFLPQAWLSKRMAEYADSPIVHIRKVDSRKRAAWYIGKYTSKAPEKFEGCKRYWRTLSYDLTGETKEKPLHDRTKGFIAEDCIHGFAYGFTVHGYAVEWDSEHSFTAYPGNIDLYAYLKGRSPPKPKNPYRERLRCN